MDRRAFLRLGVGGAAAVAAQPVLGRDPASAAPAPGPFGHGVASGDPLGDRVVLWTRVTPSVEATPGSGLGAATEVRWEVATDAAFEHVVAAGGLTTSADRDHTAKVDVTGLEPSTSYWYRFRALGATSPVGRTKTAPGPDDDVDLLRIGLATCSNWEGGWFSAYRHLADRDDLDVVLHLGDYLYEYGEGGYGPGASYGRSHDPVHEMVSLEDYRRRHALYKTDPDLGRLHARHPMVTTIDDHEVTDNSWAEGAANHQPDEGDYRLRRRRALQAYAEWMPIRMPGGPEDPERIYRGAPLGRLADLFVLDERSYRSHQPAGLAGDLVAIGPDAAAPDRTMLGEDQRDWLLAGLAGSTATWKLVVNPVMFSPFVLLDVPDLPGVTDLVLTLLALPGVSLPIVLNGDQWDGYQHEQARLRQAFAEHGGVVVLTGDIHSSWSAEVPADPATYLPGIGGPSVAVELVTPAVTSDSLTSALESAGLPVAGLAGALPPLVQTAMPWFKYLDPDRQGYSVLEVTPDHVHWDLFHISDRADRNATTSRAVSFRSPAGSDRLVPADELGPRPQAEPAPEPTTPVPPSTPTGARLPATGTGIPLGAAAVAAGAGLVAAAVRRRTTVATPVPEDL